jgi:uncharacterized NAD-dependent epimerase/dehydratase family protein
MQMHTLPAYRRIAILAEGRLGVFSSKTAAALLRYRPGDIVAIVDSQAAGSDPRKYVPWSPPIPILPDVASSLTYQPQALFVGIAPPGGDLPDDMRRHIREALAAGIDVVSGLHVFLGDDPDLSQLAASSGASILDLRRPPATRRLASARALTTRCRRILTVGSDGNVGKMVAALELTAAACRRNLDARFLATGQTGIMVAGSGIVIDAVPADFAPGAAEDLVLSAAQADLAIVEGQGSLAHPGFSAATLALVHGVCPDAMILVHHAGRTHYKALPDKKLPPLTELRALYEAAASILHPARVVAVAVNFFGVEASKKSEFTRSIEDELRLPAADVFEPGGADRLLDAALANPN